MDTADKTLPFKKLTIMFGLNETSLDAEVTMTAKAFEGMTHFVVHAPKGKKILDLKPKDFGSSGPSQLCLKSGEPSIDDVVDAYPEGRYQFQARTISGAALYGEASLNHLLLPAPLFFPCNRETLPADSVVVRWEPVENASAYQLKIKQDERGVVLSTTLMPEKNCYKIPSAFLIAGLAYAISIATITAEGNRSSAEGRFSTVMPTRKEAGQRTGPRRGFPDPTIKQRRMSL